MGTKQQVSRVEKEDEKPKADAREAPVLKPAALDLQSEGFRWREWLCRLPADAIMDDLREPGIWRVIQQQSQKSLRALDRVTFLAHDQSWMPKDVVVIEADSHRVVLAIKPGDVIRMQAKSATFEDERHVIKWTGAGFGVFRRVDDVQIMPQVFGTLEAARAVMYRNLYATRVVR
jgi:hypothetical protein